MKNKWLVVSYCTADLGAWLFDSKKEALKRKKEITGDKNEYCDSGDVELFYGKIKSSKDNFKI
jgi:hypothetical protein